MKSRISFKSRQVFQLINQSQTNNSKTKQTHSFSKSRRFFDQKPTCRQNYYAGEQIRSKKSGAGIGYSQKYDFTKVLTASPGTGRYSIKSDLQQKLDKKKGCTFGLGRDKVISRQYISRQLCRTPSADKYKINLSTRLNAPNYSIKRRTKMINKSMTIQAQNNNPGPSDYRNPEENANGKYISKYPSISYQASKSKRFQTQDNSFPGPGSYIDLSKLSTAGKSIVSNHQGGAIVKFGRSQRITKFDEQISRSKIIPGVGSYKAPSQFGQYD